LRFIPDGTAAQVYFDAGWCDLKGTDFGTCLLEKLAGTHIPPFDDPAPVEFELQVRVEGSGTATVSE
jgi:hypothetical protein